MTSTQFPVLDSIPELQQALATSRQCILVAPPGAGKTTQVPVAMLTADWLGSKGIIMLEPRRLAARSAAAFMASQLGEQVGQTVGYSVRLDRKVGKHTRIEVVTEGILTRRLQQDPELEGIGLVIFDEFHERNIHSDLGLALLRDIQNSLRDDLRLLVMSATLDVAGLQTYFDGVPEIVSEGKQYQVKLHYLERNPDRADMTRELSQAVTTALNDSDGDVLVFLPGVAEIERARDNLAERLSLQVDILPLHGSLPLSEQDRVIRPAAAGQRKVILATNIAETSLTIDGLTAVIDTGFVREVRFRADSGMTQLQTVRITADSASQRCGRAGRQGPGHCYRLWSRHTQAGLVPKRIPEIMQTDLVTLMLELACWGVADITQLQWLDLPPQAHVDQACDVLMKLKAVDADRRITTLGKKMSELGMNPRLAAMILQAGETDSWSACVLAALIEERDIVHDNCNGSIELRIHMLTENRAGGKGKRIMDIARQYAQRMHSKPGQIEEQHAGRLLAMAYPDRIARHRGDDNSKRYLLSNGRGARLHEEDMAAGEFIVITDIDDRSGDSRIFRYAGLSREDISLLATRYATTQDEVEWDDRQQKLLARSVTRLGAIELDSKPLDKLTDEQAVPILLEHVYKSKLACLPWTETTRNLQARIQLAAQHEAGWPHVSDEALLSDMTTWLSPYLSGLRSQNDISKLDMHRILKSQLDWNQQQWLDQYLPERYLLPCGRHARIDYLHQPLPLMRSRVQDFFGLSVQPKLANGRLEVIIELLSPANRPVQRTQDIAGFWSGSYADVRKEMKGRYPKHKWPENPATCK